jgi:hypothetical protein
MKQCTYWNELQLIAKVRHCIAHVGGYVPSANDPAALRAVLRRLEFGVAGGYVVVPKEAPLRIIEWAKGWLYEVVGNVEHALDGLRSGKRGGTSRRGR